MTKNYNLFIAYKTDEKLNPDGYSKVHESLKALGSTPQRIHEGLWFILSNNDALEVFTRLKNYTLQGDSFAVIEGSDFIRIHSGYDTIRGSIKCEEQP